jgi:hypothetical protein
MSEVQSVFYMIWFHVRSPVRLLYNTFHVRSQFRLLYYTVSCRKSSPSFILYGSMSEVQSVFYTIRFHVRSPVVFNTIRFHIRSPVRLLNYTVPCRKSSPSFILYGSMSEVQSVFYTIRFHVRSPVHFLYDTVPCQKSNPSFILHGALSEVQSVFYIIWFQVGSPVREKKKRPTTLQWQTLLQNLVSSTPRHRTHNCVGDRH